MFQSKMSSKKQELVCRTCLRVINDKELYTNAETRTNCGKVIDILETCVSELNLDLTDEVVLCCNCFTMLRIAYDFKVKCINTEETVFSYLQERNLTLTDKIRLTDVITSTSTAVDIESGGMLSEVNSRTCLLRSDVPHVTAEMSSTYNNFHSDFIPKSNMSIAENKKNEYSVIMFDNVPLLNRVVDDNYNVRSFLKADCNMILDDCGMNSKNEEYFDNFFNSVSIDESVIIDEIEKCQNSRI